MADSRVRVPWYLLIAVVVLPGVFSAITLSISLDASKKAVEAESRSRRASELALCQVLTIWDNANAQTPPDTRRGVVIASAIQNLIRANHCP